MADAPLHLRILTKSDSVLRDIPLMSAQGFPGEPLGFATKPRQAEPDLPDLELVYHVPLLPRASPRSPSLGTLHPQIKQSFLNKKNRQNVAFCFFALSRVFLRSESLDISSLLTPNNDGEQEAGRIRTRKGKTRYLETLGKSPVLLTPLPVFWAVVSKEALSHQTCKGAWLEGDL